MRLLFLSFIVLLSACKETQADADIGLYDPVPPAGSAFVRFLNLSDQSYTPKAKSKKYPSLSARVMSSYYVVPEGEVAFLKSLKESVQVGEFYTVVNKGQGVVIQDQANQDRTKATVALYNLSDQVIGLKAREGSVSVLEEVQINTMKARDMNAVKVDFGIYQNDKLLENVGDKVLERGNHYSIVFDGQQAHFITATTDTRQ